MKQRLLYSFYAFVLTIVAFCLFLALYGVLGNGNYTILRGDLFAQYVDFISMYIRVLKGEEDFWYSFSLFYGSGTILTYAYYVFSPINLLYLIDTVSIATMTTIVITLKIALCGFSFALFAQTVLKCKPRNAIFFALCYAMNGFVITLHFNMIWLEAAYMLPLAIMLLFRLVETGKWLALVPVWAFLFVTNFYMAYIVGIFSFFVFVGILVLRMPAFSKDALKQSVRPTVRFFASVLLATLLSAAILVPTAVFLLSHMAADNYGFEPLPTSLLDVVGSLFIGEMPDIDNRVPFLYCGLPVLLLFPFYFTQRKISSKERLITGSVLVFFVLCMLVLPLFIFMHAFDYPNWYFFRFSFCVCFMLCAMACRTADLATEQLSFKHIAIYAASLLVFYSFMIGFGSLIADSDDIKNTPRELAINLLFIVLWLIVFHLIKHPSEKEKRRRLVGICTFVVLIIELAWNGKLCLAHIGLTPESEAEFNTWYQSENNALSEIPADDPDLYRVAMYGESNCNAPAFWGYAGFNTFSSSDAYELRRFLNGLGIAGGNRYIDELGYTDVTRMLFGVKYIGSIIQPDKEVAQRESSLTVFPYYLPFAYMVSDQTLNYSATIDPFLNQEQLVQCMTGNRYHFFDRIDLTDIEPKVFNAEMTQIDDYNIFRRKSHFAENASIYFTAPKREGQPFFVYFHQDQPSADLLAPYVIGSQNCFAIASTLSYGSLYQGDSFNGAIEENTETVAIYFQGNSFDEYLCKQIYLAYQNDAELPAAWEDLSSGAMQITSHSSSVLQGTVQVDEAHPILFTSIPYEKGWQATVDGSEAEIFSLFDDAFLSLRLTPGTHEVCLKYIAPGSQLGLYLTIGGFVIYLLLCVVSMMRQSKVAKK